MESEITAFIYLFLGIFAPGFLYFFKGFRDFSKKRLIENIPTTKIRSLAMGPVEICGIVVPARGVLTAPYSRRKCVYYKWIAEKFGGESYDRSTLDSEESMLAFYLQDDTGKVLIDAREADIRIAEEYDFYQNLMYRFPDDLDRFIKSRDMLGYPNRFVEYAIKPGDKLYIMGTAAKNRHARKAGDQTEQTNKIVIKEGKENWFYISNRREKRLVNILKWKSFWEVAGGILLMSIAIALFVLYCQSG